MSSSSIVEADIEEEEDAVDTFLDSNPDDVVDTESRLLFKKFTFKLHMVDMSPIFCSNCEINNTQGVPVHDEADLDRVVR